MQLLAKKSVSIACALIALALSPSFVVLACDYHGDMSFGGMGPMRGFGQGHPLMQRHMLEARPAQLKLNHESLVVAPINEKQSIDINYFLPPEFKDATLRFTHSDGIALDVDDKIAISELNGVYTLDYSVTEGAKQHILVWVDAVKATLPYSRVQRIVVLTD